MTELTKLIQEAYEKVCDRNENEMGAISRIFTQFHKDLLAFFRKGAVDVTEPYFISPKWFKAVPMSVLEGEKE